jgi:hypothetical protein
MPRFAHTLPPPMHPISPTVLENLDALSARFREGQPFRHVVIDDFLDPEFCERLRRDFPGFEERFAINELGEVGGKAVRTDVRDISEAYRELDRFIQTPGFLDSISRITGIPDLLYDPDYVGGGTHENRHGQSLDPHIDFNYHPGTRWHRRLNLIVYLNPEWQEAWGGNIEFHSDPWRPERNSVTSVLPMFNRAVIFETNEVSWHGFGAIRLPEEGRDLSRRSFAIYLYTRERPAAETAPPHATVYVPESLPEEVRPGAVLKEAQHAAIDQRFRHMLRQLKFLYDRELHFAGQIAVLERALEEARAVQHAGLEGYAQQDASSGLWPDGWAAQQARLRFTPSRHAEGLELTLWVPDRMDGAQAISATLAGERIEATVRPGRSETLRFRVGLPAGRPAELEVVAERAWSPHAAGDSEDERGLAWRRVALVLLH